MVADGSSLHEALRYIIAAAVNMPDQGVHLTRPEPPPILIYTDASASLGLVRLGAKIVLPDGSVHITIYDPHVGVMASRGPQDTIINQAELHCGILVAETFPDLQRGRDVIWWIDNSSAATSLVKAGSPTESMCRLAVRATAMLSSLGSRCWFEHVPSDDNPADVLSRAGLDDPEVRENVARGAWSFQEPVHTVPSQTSSYDALWHRGLGEG